MPLDAAELASPILRLFVFIFRHILWDLILETFVWKWICCNVGWFVLRVCTLGKHPETSWRETIREEELFSGLAGFATLAIVFFSTWWQL